MTKISPTEETHSPDDSADVETELARRTFQLQTLQDLSRNIGPLRDVEDLLKTGLLYVMGVVGALRGFAFLHDRRDHTTQTVPWRMDPERLESLLSALESDPLDALSRRTEPWLTGRVDAEQEAGPDGSERAVCSDLVEAGIEVWMPVNPEGAIGGIGLGGKLSGAPFSPDDLDLLSTIATSTRIAIENARRYEQLQQENRYLRNEVRRTYRFEEIVGTSPAMERVYDLLDRVIHTDTTVLLAGETGTGKELIARAIHYNSPRKDRRFIAQNCAALPETLLESELFGHKRGSFTGATSDKKGLFELADRGTIFLDEIGDTSPKLQVRLLRVLQEGELRPVGASEWKHVDVRVISATNIDLEDALREGRFRDDLYFRLSVFPILIPPLRERRDDIPLLAHHFLKRYAEKKGISVRGFTPEAMDALMDYAFPGNIRELENEIQRAVVLAGDGDILGLGHLSPKLRRLDDRLEQALHEGGAMADVVERLKDQMIRGALRESGGNKAQAARDLGVTRAGLVRMMARYGIVAVR